jgi:hypothetical protein
MTSEPIVIYPRGKHAIRIIGIVLLVLLLVGVAYYPIALAISASWISIASGIQSGDNSINPSVAINFPLTNNAPVHVPGFKPQYTMTVAILSGSTQCWLETLDGLIPCSSSTYISVGSLMPGDTAYSAVYLTPDGKSFTIQASGYLDFFSHEQRVASVTYQCDYVGTGLIGTSLYTPYAYHCLAK